MVWLTWWHCCKAAGEQSRAEARVVAAPRTEAQTTAVWDNCAGREAQRSAVRTEGPETETGLLHADAL